MSWKTHANDGTEYWVYSVREHDQVTDLRQENERLKARLADYKEGFARESAGAEAFRDKCSTLEAQLANLRAAAESAREFISGMMQNLNEPHWDACARVRADLNAALNATEAPARNCCEGGGCSDRCYYDPANLPCEAPAPRETFVVDVRGCVNQWFDGKANAVECMQHIHRLLDAVRES